jgi:transcriptional regulator with XRE-family HTH domain
LASRQAWTPESSTTNSGGSSERTWVLLRNARQKQQISLDQASTATRIKPLFLEALEEGDYHLLPGPAYVTGFLRNYAQFLGLQPDEIVQEYYAEQPSPQPAVKAATRVLASGYERQLRARFSGHLVDWCYCWLAASRSRNMTPPMPAPRRHRP